MYTSAIQACTKSNKLHQAMEVFHNMAHKRIAKNVITYTILMDALVKAELYDEVFNFFDAMLREKISPSIKVIISCIYHSWIFIYYIDILI